MSRLVACGAVTVPQSRPQQRPRRRGCGARDTSNKRMYRELEKTAPSHRLNKILPLLLMPFWSELCAAATQGSLSNYQAKLQALTGALALAPCEVFCKVYDVLCAKMLQRLPLSKYLRCTCAPGIWPYTALPASVPSFTHPAHPDASSAFAIAAFLATAGLAGCVSAHRVWMLC